MEGKAQFGISKGEEKVFRQYTSPASINFSINGQTGKPLNFDFPNWSYESKYIRICFGGSFANNSIGFETGQLIFRIKEFGKLESTDEAVQTALQTHKHRLEWHFNQAAIKFIDPANLPNYEPIRNYKVDFTFTDAEFTQKRVTGPASIFFDLPYEIKNGTYFGRAKANSQHHNELEIRFAPGAQTQQRVSFHGSSLQKPVFIFTDLGLLQGDDVDELFQHISVDTIRAAFKNLLTNIVKHPEKSKPKLNFPIESWSVHLGKQSTPGNPVYELIVH